MAVKFDKVHKATTLGLSHFRRCLPILLRAILVLLFAWYSLELFLKAKGLHALFLALSAGLFLVVFLSVMIGTYLKYPWPSATNPWRNDDAIEVSPTGVWPFLLINLLMVILVAAIGQWEQDPGLLGYTQRWVRAIARFFAGGLR